MQGLQNLWGEKYLFHEIAVERERREPIIVEKLSKAHPWKKGTSGRSRPKRGDWREKSLSPRWGQYEKENLGRTKH